jgi:hypothetical protein
MNARFVIRGSATLLCIFAAFVLVRSISGHPNPATPKKEAVTVSEIPNSKPASSKPDKVLQTPRGIARSAEKRVVGITEANKAAVIVPLDQDDAFLEKIASLPLERAALETRLEVERRIKEDERERAKQIFSEDKNGKLTIAYAIKKASSEEIRAATSPYKLLLDLQESVAGKKYVEERYDRMFKSYRLGESEYQLVYAVIPKNADGSPVENYSYAASSEQECIEILHEELAPRPPVVMGVPFSDSSRDRSSSNWYEIIPGDWRMDHLVSKELLEPFYSRSQRAQMSRVESSKPDR